MHTHAHHSPGAGHRPELNNRRQQPRKYNAVYQVAVGLNVAAWLVLFGALLVFHFARPDFIAGVQRYWNLPGNNLWSAELVQWLFLLLQVCLSLGLVAIGIKWRRNRRRHDEFGVNLFILLGIGLLSLLGLALNFG